VIVSPGDLSSLTVAARLRDAMSSLYRYEWETQEVEIDKFRRVYKDMVVSHRGVSIYVGSREAIRMYDPIHPIIALTEAFDKEPSKVYGLTVDQVRFVCLLIVDKMFSRPMTCRCNEINCVGLENDFDVVVEKNEDGSFTIS